MAPSKKPARTRRTASPARVRVGVIGCGAISPAYFRGLKPYPFVEVAACADLDPARARARAEEFGVPASGTVDELLADPSLGIILNLTTPQSHASLSLRALAAGKSVYLEKPLALAKGEGRKVVDFARKKKLRVGCAPDTFLGGGLQTCRRLLDQGKIGRPVAATAFMLGHGHESWHPNPEFYYKAGGGPLFDMGPYYLTALVHLLGPVARVAAISGRAFSTRVITSEPKRGQLIRVDVPTHDAATLEFRNGAIASLVTSFDVWAHSLPRIEVYGTEGSLGVPDPNGFAGTVRLRRMGEKEWSEIPLTHPVRSRGAGLADMALALRSGRPHRASGNLALHVLEVMCAIHESGRKGRHVAIEGTCERPAPLPVRLADGEMDA